MECSQIRAILFENADTEIPVEFRKGVEEHLAVCLSCAMQLEALREQSNALGTLSKMEAPGDFLEQVRSRVEKPSLLARFKQGLPVLFTGNQFFKLAGAAATALLVIVTVQVALRDGGGRKAVFPPAPSSVQLPPKVVSPPSAEPPAPVVSPPYAEAPAALPASPPSVGSSRSVEAPAAAPVMPESLPDIRKKNGKAFDRAASPSKPEPKRYAVVEEQSVALTVKPPRTSARGKTPGGSFKPESLSASRPGAARMGASAGKLKQDVSKGGGGAPEVSEYSPTPEGKKISSDVILLIKRADGEVLSTGPTRDENHPGTLHAEIPAANYSSFLDQLRKLGEVELSGDKEISAAPDTKVRVSVSFDTRD